MTRGTAVPVAGRWLAFAAPMVLLGIAWVAWTISDRMLWIGPMDRAFFGWAVVVPLFMLVAPVAAVAWRSLDRRAQFLAAGAVCAATTVVGAVVLARDIGSAACDTAPLRSVFDGFVAGTVVGLIGGGGLGLSGLLGARTPTVRRGVMMGAVLGVASIAAWGLAFGVAISFPGCARP